MIYIKTIRSICLSLSLVIATHTTHPMDQAEFNKWGSGITLIIGGILLGKVALQTLWKTPESFPFTDLPQDIQKEIIILLAQTTHAKTIDEAIKPIQSLSMVNKQLHNLFKDKNFTDTLITHLSQKFNEGYMSIAKALGTPTAKILYYEENIKIHNAQNLVSSIYRHDNQLFNTTIQKKNINTNVRVLNKEYTALMLSVSLPKNQPTHQYHLSDATIKYHYQWCHENNIVQQILEHNGLATTINEKDIDGNTALLLALIECENLGNRNWIKPSIKMLLDHDANPKLANNEGLTPLQAAINTNDQEIINLIENALSKK